MSIRIGDVRSWRAAGLSASRLRAAVRDGDLVRIRRGVYASRGFADKARDQPVIGHVLRVAAAQCGQSSCDAVFAASTPY